MPLGFAELASFDNRRSSARRTFSTGLARNTFNRGQADLAAVRGRRNLALSFRGGREKLGTSFAVRGLNRSGVFADTLTRFNQDKATAFADLNTDIANRLSGLDLDQLGLESQLASQLSQIESEQQSRRAQVAADLRSVV